MIGKTNCTIISIALVIISSLLMMYWYFNFDVPYTSKMPTLWMVLFTLIVPVISQICYFNSKFNSGTSLILAFLTSVICFSIYTFTYYLKINFDEYYVRSSGVIIGLFILAQLVITLIFATIYFAIWWRQKK
jgi:hypothetical protein